MIPREVEASLDAVVLRAPARSRLTSFSLQRGQSLDLRITFGDPQMGAGPGQWRLTGGQRRRLRHRLPDGHRPIAAPRPLRTGPRAAPRI